MPWLLLIAGAVLVVAGVWRGPGGHAVSDRAEPVARPDLSRAEAWDILTRPMGVEEKPLGPRARRTWSAPGRERRFLRGLLVGIGSGLVVMALIMLALPTPVRPPHLDDGEATPPGNLVRGPLPGVSPSPDPKPLTRTFVVEDGEAAPTIAAKLRGAGLIVDEAAFIRRVADRRLDTRLKAGTFIISTGASLDEVIDSLTA